MGVALHWLVAAGINPEEQAQVEIEKSPLGCPGKTPEPHALLLAPCPGKNACKGITSSPGPLGCPGKTPEPHALPLISCLALSYAMPRAARPARQGIT
eukprot:1161840-Pelagomonas_calceolata.AAC.8